MYFRCEFWEFIIACGVQGHTCGGFARIGGISAFTDLCHYTTVPTYVTTPRSQDIQTPLEWREWNHELEAYTDKRFQLTL